MRRKPCEPRCAGRVCSSGKPGWLELKVLGPIGVVQAKESVSIELVARYVSRFRLGHRGATILAVVTATFALSSAGALAAGPLAFSAPVPIDTKPLTGVSCPSIALCVAVDSAGNVLVSSDPIGGQGTWESRSVNPPNPTDETPGGFNAISCPSTSFCVAVGAFGQAATSTDPAVLSSWELIPMGIDEPANLTGVSCSSPTRCVAVDNQGFAVTADVAEGEPLIWTRTSTQIDSETTNISGLSCVSTDLCVAIDTYGDAITATQTDPTAWNGTVLIEPQAHTMINGVACASVTLCAAVDVSGSVLVSTNPRAISPTWTPPVQVEGSYLTAVACVSGPLCVAVDGSGRATVSSDPAGRVGADWFGPTPIDPASGTPAHSLTAVSCASSVECVAVDDAGNVIVGSVQHALTVTVAGSGKGTVTGPAIACPTSCTSRYLAGTAVPLAATAAKGSTFHGWSAGCLGTGACTATLSSDQAVTATFITVPPDKKPPAGKAKTPNTVVTGMKTNRRQHSETFRFHAVGVSTGLQCADVRQPIARRHARRPKPAKPRFTACRSPKAYKRLKPGTYVFSVRALGPGGTDRTPARRIFKIR